MKFHSSIVVYSKKALALGLYASKQSKVKLRLNVALLILPGLAVFALVSPSLKRRALSRQTESQATTSIDKRMYSFHSLPLAFEPNQGQMTSTTKFVAHASGSEISLTTNALIFSLTSHQVTTGSESNPAISKEDQAKRLQNHKDSRSVTNRDVISVGLTGARSPRISVVDELPGTVSYFIGKDQKNWHTNIKTYRRVKYEGVYPGIDQIFYGNGEQLEYDFIVSAGANPGTIRLQISGQNELSIDGAGDLVLLSQSSHKIGLHKPFAYQEEGEFKREIVAHYLMKRNHQIGLEIGPYDRSKELIIDPAVSYSTYLGGTGNDAGFGVAVDSNGNSYVTGSTDSPSFSSVQGSNAFVAKFNASGTQRTYLAIVGGGGDDTGFSAAIDASGNAYLTGITNSVDFPVANPIQSNFGGGSLDAFVAKLNPSGSALIYSTYLGGSGTDKGFGIAVESGGSAYITGSTDSSEFSNRGGPDAFVTKINSTGTQREYFATLGGAGDDTGFDIAVGVDGSATIVGTTNSSDFTTTNALQPNFGGSQDAFVAKLNSIGSAPIYSTYFGGSGTDSGFGVALDGAGNAYVTGSTDSPEFTNLGGTDVFVAKLSSSGNERTYLVSFGGNANDAGLGIAVDNGGNAYVTGATASNNFTTVNALQPNPGGSQDAFVAKLNQSGSALIYSTYLGGSGNDFGSSIAVDNNGNAYVTGSTTSSNFPTSAALQSAIGGNGDAFLTKITDSGPSPSPSPSPGASPSPSPSSSPIQLMLDASGPAPDQLAALDSVLFFRDPFPVVNSANLLNQGSDRNTRVVIFATNLQLAQGETSSSVVVNLVDANNQNFDVSAEDVRTVPNFDFTQVIFRLPNNLSIGTCTIKLKAHNQISNSGSIRIRN